MKSQQQLKETDSMKTLYKFIAISLFCFNLVHASTSSDIEVMQSKLSKYKEFLREGTISGQNFSVFKKYPKMREYTFDKAFTHFINKKGKVIVELGTTRSFTHGGLVGCNKDDPIYWTPDQPENWDWGAGAFTRVCAESLEHMNIEFHTVDLIRSHIARCKLITQPFSGFINYHVCSSLIFLRDCSFDHGIDLLYIDTGDMTPIEKTAQLQLEEAIIICERDLISKNGIIVIDDIRNTAPFAQGEKSRFGKGKYSIPYFLNHGFEILHDEYQMILKKKQ